MFGVIRNRLRALRTFREAADMLKTAAAYERDAEYHRLKIKFHQTAEAQAKIMARAARETAKKL